MSLGQEIHTLSWNTGHLVIIINKTNLYNHDGSGWTNEIVKHVKPEYAKLLNWRCLIQMFTWKTQNVYQKLQHDDIGMSSKNLLEDWLKMCDAITYFNYGS